MTDNDTTTKPAKKSRAVRRIQKQPVVPKFSVGDDDFLSEDEAERWSEALYVAEKFMAEDAPQLTEERAKSQAKKAAKVALMYEKKAAQSGGTSASVSAESDDEDSAPPYTNGADSTHAEGRHNVHG